MVTWEPEPSRIRPSRAPFSTDCPGETSSSIFLVILPCINRTSMSPASVDMVIRWCLLVRGQVDMQAIVSPGTDVIESIVPDSGARIVWTLSIPMTMDTLLSDMSYTLPSAGDTMSSPGGMFLWGSRLKNLPNAYVPIAVNGNNVYQLVIYLVQRT